jgi:hypothetical protein
MLACAAPVEYLDFSRYKGDAEVWERTEDNTYPKYWVLFPEIAIDRPGTYAYQVTGLPKSDYYLGLAVREDAERVAVGGARSRCEVEIMGTSGELIMRLGGTIEEGDPASHSNWSGSDGFWIKEIRHPMFWPNQMSLSNMFHPDPNVEYTFRFLVQPGDRVHGGDASALPPVTPVLWAGGKLAKFFAFE